MAGLTPLVAPAEQRSKKGKQVTAFICQMILIAQWTLLVGLFTQDASIDQQF